MLIWSLTALMPLYMVLVLGIWARNPMRSGIAVVIGAVGALGFWGGQVSVLVRSGDYPVLTFCSEHMPAFVTMLIVAWSVARRRGFWWVLAIPVIMLLANRGAINFSLRELGLIERPIPMLYTFFSLSFGVIYLVALYMLLPLYSSLEKIPQNLVDAASDLGASPATRFRRVILPLSQDGIVSGCSLVFLTTVGVFAAPLLLGGPTTTIFPEVIAQLFHSSNDKWPAGAAFSIIMLVVALSTVGLFMRAVGGRSARLM